MIEVIEKIKVYHVSVAENEGDFEQMFLCATVDDLLVIVSSIVDTCDPGMHVCISVDEMELEEFNNLEDFSEESVN